MEEKLIIKLPKDAPAPSVDGDFKIIVNNAWLRKLCRKNFEKKCNLKDCESCVKNNGFSYKIFNKLVVKQGSKVTFEHPIRNISRDGDYFNVILRK